MKRTPQFTPYANESDVVHVGGLMVENRLDRITLSGDVDLTADQAGLAHALQLQALIGAIVTTLRQSPLPDALAPAQVRSEDNPFS